MCKSGRGWLTRRGVALLYIPIFMREGGLREILSKDMGGGLIYKFKTPIFYIDGLTLEITVYFLVIFHDFRTRHSSAVAPGEIWIRLANFQTKKFGKFWKKFF